MGSEVLAYGNTSSPSLTSIQILVIDLFLARANLSRQRQKCCSNPLKNETVTKTQVSLETYQGNYEMQKRLAYDISLTWQSSPGPRLPRDLYPDLSCSTCELQTRRQTLHHFPHPNGSDASVCCTEQACKLGCIRNYGGLFRTQITELTPWPLMQWVYAGA